jgi:hypothetical protein
LIDAGFLFFNERSAAMSAVGNFIKNNIIKPIEKAVEGIGKMIGKGMECLTKLAQGDLKGAATAFMEGVKGALDAVSAASDLVPGLKMTPMGMLKDKAAGLAGAGLEMGADLAKTGGKNMGKIAKNAVMDALPKPSDFIPPGVQMAMDAVKPPQG